MDIKHLSKELVVGRQDILDQLERHRTEIQDRFGIDRIALFGSIARDNFTDESDLDVLIEFREGEVTLENFLALQKYLEDLLGRNVDLVTEYALRKELRPYVERDLIVIA